MGKKKFMVIVLIEVLFLFVLSSWISASELNRVLLQVAQDKWNKVQNVSLNSSGTSAEIKVDFGELPWTWGIADVCDMRSGEILEAVFKKSSSLKSIRRVTIRVFATGLDMYGNETKILIYTVVADRETVEKINFDNLGYALAVRSIFYPHYHPQIKPR